MIIREILWRDSDFDGCIWTHNGKDADYSSLNWNDSNTVTKPTEAELTTKWTAVKEEIILEHLRAERDKKLAECDWVVVKHTELGTSIPANWSTYRQSLRDITSDITGIDMVTQDDGWYHDITGITWPTKPE